MLLVDSGNFLADDRSTHGMLRRDAIVKNESVLKAYDQFTVDVVNLSERDLPFISGILLKEEFARRAEAQPVLKRLVSANTVCESTAVIQPQPFVIREVPDRVSGKPVRVGFVGVSAAGGLPLKGLRLSDPIGAAKKAVPEARRRADVVIMLAHLSVDEAVRLAREVPGLDVVIAGTGQLFSPPVKLGQTLVVFTPFETRLVGELRFHRDARGKISAKDRYISLDDGLPDDPAAQELATAVRDENNAAMKRFKSDLTGLGAGQTARQPTADQDAITPNGYRSARACSSCHLAQYMQWANSAHARATDALVTKPIEFDSGCLACHATGFEHKSLTGATNRPGLPNVQCEQCHGPASDHLAKPGKGYGRISDRRALCATCHTPETSAHFDLKTQWAKVQH